MSTVLGRALAPAKINYGLSVLGKRGDGYHEIKSELHTISLFDRVTMTGPGTGIVRTTVPALDQLDNVMTKAAREIASRVGRALDVNFTVDKRIPIAAGLGGGSSDAAAVLRLLCRHWSLDVQDPRVWEAAAATGSDVPFFLQGGPSLVSGRGENVEQLSAMERRWIVLVVPPLTIASKTTTLYGALRASDFSTLDDWNAHDPSLPRRNVFTRPLYDLYPQILETRDVLQSHSRSVVHLSGAGPAHYVRCAELDTATTLLRSISSDHRLMTCTKHLAVTIKGPGPLDIQRNCGQ